MTSALEAMMLICFGFSWPINLIKNIKAKTAKSMSLKFIILIIMGYIAGISAKLISHNINYVLAIYLLNLAIVSVNVVVYFINTKKDKQRDNKTTTTVYQSESKGRFSDMNKIAKSDSIVFFGSNYFSQIPFGELGKCYNLDENLYNRSTCDKSIDELCEMMNECVFDLMPSKVFINIGEKEAMDNTLDISEFVEKYEWLLYTINQNTDADIYIVSVMAEHSAKINEELRKLATQYGCKYIDITSVYGAPNQSMRAFNIMKVHMHQHPITFYEAMNM